MPHELNVVLVEPEIPQNTGSVGRLCLATGSNSAFGRTPRIRITHSRLRRAGLDYWEHLNVVRHPSLDEFLASLPAEAPKVFFQKKRATPYLSMSLSKGLTSFLAKRPRDYPRPS